MQDMEAQQQQIVKPQAVMQRGLLSEFSCDVQKWEGASASGRERCKGASSKEVHQSDTTSFLKSEHFKI